ncbi:hypothetical protein F5Y16DRAFT_363712 [Xylariaceae sp. FL0255]|nr:hypothetical protein F5Y16DRAFT_363712 [Xylariaceae sp. FL0255]
MNNRDFVYEGPPGDQDVLKNDDNRIVTRASTVYLRKDAAETQKKAEERARLDQIVADGFRAIDACVSDKPISSSRHRKKRPIVESDDSDFLMSGGLLTDPTILSTAWASTDMTAPAEDNSTPQVTAETTRTQPPSVVTPQVSTDANSPTRIGGPRLPYYHDRVVVKAESPVFAPLSSPLGDRPGSDSKGVGQPGGISFRNVRKASRMSGGSNSSTETPVPPPQPWKVLGIENPFSEKQSSSTAAATTLKAIFSGPEVSNVNSGAERQAVKSTTSQNKLSAHTGSEAAQGATVTYSHYPIFNTKKKQEAPKPQQDNAVINLEEDGREVPETPKPSSGSVVENDRQEIPRTRRVTTPNSGPFQSYKEDPEYSITSSDAEREKKCGYHYSSSPCGL